MQRVREATGHDFRGEDVIIIGDTPADIRCARSGGGRAISVATGPYSAEALSRHQPDHLFRDLARVEEVLKVLGRPMETASD
ncbi:MAG: HAD hydrolase-like protein [Anaerolineae bacterium]|nr:HAD hydrolase-like protein [Anaerolineae bacterium]